MALVGMLGFMLSVAALGGLTHLEVVSVREVIVRGAERLSPESVSAVVQETLTGSGFSLFSPNNIFLYPHDQIEEQLPEKFPRIKKVTVGRESLLAQAVIVTVEERVPFATWCAKDDACYVMDEKGYLFDVAGDSPQSPYVFRGGLLPHTEIIGQIFLEGRLSQILSLMEKLEEAGFHSRGMMVESEEDFTVTLLSGQRILMAFDSKESEVMHNLETALQSDSLRTRLPELEYIDLRFGNRVYYK